jgi:hypothetical protein
MRARQGWLTLTAGLLVCAGCASDNRIVGNRTIQGDTWYGDFGIVGHLNEVTVRTGSKLHKLKVAGDGNKVWVEDHVPLGKVEVWGANNELNVPETLYFVRSVWGKGNRIVTRPRGMTQAEFLRNPPITYRPTDWTAAEPAPSGDVPADDTGSEAAAMPVSDAPREPANP